jgi:hypothetical protein
VSAIIPTNTEAFAAAQYAAHEPTMDAAHLEAYRTTDGSTVVTANAAAIGTAKHATYGPAIASSFSST